MNTLKKLPAFALLIACGIPVATAHAGFMAMQSSIPGAADPLGFQTYQTLAGNQGVAADPSKWFDSMDGYSTHTLWSDRAITFAAAAPIGGAPVRLGVTAFNYGKTGLPADYSDFIVSVSVNGAFMKNVSIAASDTSYNTSWFDLGHQAGNLNITLVWTNKRWKRDVFDTNIAFTSLQFAAESMQETVGFSVPSSGSTALAAMSCVLVIPRRHRS